jgi:hypothetical protein
MRSLQSWHSSLGRVSLALFFFLATALSATAQTALPQSPQTTQEYATLLVSRLEARKIQAEKQVTYWTSIIESLKSENAKDKQSSIESSAQREKAEAELKKSQADLTEISRLLELSRSDFEAYKTETQKQISGLTIEVKAYKTAARIAVPTAVIAVGVIAGRLIGWW